MATSGDGHGTGVVSHGRPLLALCSELAIPEVGPSFWPQSHGGQDFHSHSTEVTSLRSYLQTQRSPVPTRRNPEPVKQGAPGVHNTDQDDPSSRGAVCLHCRKGHLGTGKDQLYMGAGASGAWVLGERPLLGTVLVDRCHHMFIQAQGRSAPGLSPVEPSTWCDGQPGWCLWMIDVPSERVWTAGAVHVWDREDGLCVCSVFL